MSWSISLFGWICIRGNTSTKYVLGLTSCSLHVLIRLWMMATCFAPSSVQQNNQLRLPIGTGRIRRSRWLVSIGPSASLRNTLSSTLRLASYVIALAKVLFGKISSLWRCSSIHANRYSAYFARWINWVYFLCLEVRESNQNRTIRCC